MWNLLDVVHDAESLEADLPYGVDLWIVRGKVLKVEIIERPAWLYSDEGRSSLPPAEAQQLASIGKTDTLVALHDKDAPTQGHEIRLWGRVDGVAQGDQLDLLGQTTPHKPTFAPRMAYSLKNAQWWFPMRPMRSGQPGYVLSYIKKNGSAFTSDQQELEDWFKIDVPAAAMPAQIPVAEPPRSIFSKLLGGTKPTPTSVKVDLWPIYSEAWETTLRNYQEGRYDPDSIWSVDEETEETDGTEDSSLPPI